MSFLKDIPSLRKILEFNPRDLDNLNPKSSFFREGVRSIFDKNYQLRAFQPNNPRIGVGNYNSDTKGLLIEPYYRNRAFSSNSFNFGDGNGLWADDGWHHAVQRNVTDVFGGNTAYRHTMSNTSQPHCGMYYRIYGVTAPGQTVTASIYVRKASQNVALGFDLYSLSTDGYVLIQGCYFDGTQEIYNPRYSVVKVGNSGWWKLTATGVAPDNNSGNMFFGIWQRRATTAALETIDFCYPSFDNSNFNGMPLDSATEVSVPADQASIALDDIGQDLVLSASFADTGHTSLPLLLTDGAINSAKALGIYSTPNQLQGWSRAGALTQAVARNSPAKLNKVEALFGKDPQNNAIVVNGQLVGRGLEINSDISPSEMRKLFIGTNGSVTTGATTVENIRMWTGSCSTEQFLKFSKLITN